MVVVAFIEHGYRGGLVAAPMVKAIFEAAKPGLVAPAAGQVSP
jgi:cell division protein FtsI/penicillin-binding protein 2